jgi:hypothetical protein
MSFELCPEVDEFRDDIVYCRYRGKEAAAIHLDVDFLKKMTIESPLLPSPLSSLKFGVIPNSSTKKINFLTKSLSVEE